MPSLDTLAAQTPGIGAAEESAHLLERTGLYGVIGFLGVALVIIFGLFLREIALRRAADAQRRTEDAETTKMIIGMVEKQTIVLTEATVANKRNELLMQQVASRLQKD